MSSNRPLLLPYPSCQGVPVELLRGPAPAGAHLDVSRARHDGQALHPLSDPLRRLRLAAGLRHRHGALHPAARGEIKSRKPDRDELSSYLCLSSAAVVQDRREYFMRAFREIFIVPSWRRELELSSFWTRRLKRSWWKSFSSSSFFFFFIIRSRTLSDVASETAKTQSAVMQQEPSLMGTHR